MATNRGRDHDELQVRTAANVLLDAAAAIRAAATAPMQSGDGDIMPPRFDGNRETDVSNWAQDLLCGLRVAAKPGRSERPGTPLYQTYRGSPHLARNLTGQRRPP